MLMSYLGISGWLSMLFVSRTRISLEPFDDGQPRLTLTTFQSSTMTVSLPPLPEGWRDDVVIMIHDFLEDAGLAQTLCALEQETG